MCGICGFTSQVSDQKSYLDKMINQLASRGPDAKGMYFDNKINLGHTRLSIIDLNERSNQPFYDKQSGNILVFNGEIYNFKEIKKNLISKGYVFKTNSDTEVLLKNFIEKSYKAFDEFEGMWAIAIWNDNKKELILSRDRFGQKPLFYSYINNDFFFGSQINQITALSDYSFKVNKKKIFDYLGAGYRVLFKDDKSFYEKIKHFPPSHYAVVKNDRIILKSTIKTNII